MKVIQVPMDEELLRAVTGKAKSSRLTRAALIRKACQEYLNKLEDDELDRRYIEGYRRKPETSVWGEVGARMAGEVLSREDWDEEG